MLVALAASQLYLPINTCLSSRTVGFGQASWEVGDQSSPCRCFGPIPERAGGRVGAGDEEEDHRSHLHRDISSMSHRYSN